ncbi:Mrp/NBP35 family ATP-binding protein [Salibacter halophilus]|uniref:Iron-sulfur cluster carrier protein n=1 Tax=Salibacter halophilus TaxID=1803916 RepID=A0A6N6M5M6_9FLAO|nr:Mrp/NBP35 family ATP-binding protein [Salibacter halophilus]KAB1062866.1 Mrp/NBP35 family ATP-binding protein [Salibacter halophilus]
MSQKKMITEEQVKEGLSYVIEPDLKKNLIEANLVSDIKIEGNNVAFVLRVNNPAMHNRKRIVDACEHYLKQHVSEDIDAHIEVKPLSEKPNDREPEQRKHMSKVKHVVAVASGKGGVGKSTVTANLAAGLVKKGYKVGLIDADIYGPSMPMMFDVVHDKPGVVEVDGRRMMTPVESPWGVKMISIGFFADPEQAVVWRGPMATKALQQMFQDVHWGDLDYMLIDLPPGTGDVHLTLVNEAPLTGAIVVSTPQAVALSDAKKGVSMFQLENINVPVLGIVENMSYFVPEDAPDKRYHIFGKDGAKNLAEDLNVNLLGQIPLVQSIREASDAGRPAVLQGDTIQARELMKFTEEVVRTLQEKKMSKV